MTDNADHHQAGRAQLRADLPQERPATDPEPREQEAVRTTIVGGRPPGSGKPIGSVPRGIEVLLKKAAVDAEFCELLLTDPERAAESIGLELEPIERAMLRGMPREQLAVIIKQTTVPRQQRRAFLGTAAAAMIAVLVPTVLTGCPDAPTKGIRPEEKWPQATGGINPDLYREPEVPEHPSGTVSAGIQPDEHFGEGGARPDLPKESEPPKPGPEA